MADDLRDYSRLRFTIPNVNLAGPLNNVEVGCLQRIADATEAMAKPFVNLVSERERYERYYKSEREDNKRLARRIAALQGVITKMKKSKSK
jgi:hypothetical protein